MKKSLVLAMAMALGVTASAYAANPFSDVPAGHWAYDSISKLAAAGVIEGYGDTTFGGDKLMTRYEMAQIVAKAMAKGANCDKLAAEFADELDNLGVRVANLEKKADNVKISGETKLRYWSYDGDGSNTDKMQQRSRVFFKGAVNEDWTFTGMLENIQTYSHDNKGDEGTSFQRAYVNGKIGGLKVQAGRYHWADQNGGLIYDDRVDAIQASYGKDVNLTVAYGKGDDTTAATGNNAEEMLYAQLATKVGVVDAKVGYYMFNDLGNVAGNDDDILTLTVGLPVAKDVKLTATYLKADDEQDREDDGYVIGLDYKGAKAAKAGSWGLFAKYYDQGAATYVAHAAEAELPGGEGFKGYMVGANYTFAKNIVGAVKYYDLEAKKADVDESTLYAELNFMF